MWQVLPLRSINEMAVLAWRVDFDEQRVPIEDKHLT